MTRSTVRSTLLAAIVSAVAAQGATAQAGGAPWSRIIVAPQLGVVVDHSASAERNVLASLSAEMPIGSAFSVAAEWTRPYGGYALHVCPAIEGDCFIGAELRSSGAVGVTVRPVRLGPLEPYAGVSGGAARWARNSESGVAGMAAMRAGVDVAVAGPFGVRADLVRRWAWADTPGSTPLRTDMVSIGARYAFRR
jgi:hypothetical protein